jgi:crotonobetainyl-CoA:carnitine CoA-transferase CaiB-like acyl-CoA transferase
MGSADSTGTPGALDGVRVLDLAGPLAEATGRVLADLGAEVLKIEPPGGCASRRLPPFAAGAEDDPDGSLFWRAWGLGKHSLVLDLDDPGDRERLVALARTADVLIESSAPGALDRVGLGPEDLIAANPTLLYASVTPFGRTGPEALSPATDLTLAAAGGFLNCQGDRDRPPVPIGVPETSCSGAVQAAADIVMALCERQGSGLGQHLDTSLQAAVLGTLLFITGYAVYDQDAPGMGDDRATAPASAFGLRIPVFAPTLDGFLGMTLVLGAPGARSLGRMMAWAAAEDGIDADLGAHDWADLFPLLAAGTLTVEDAQRGLDQLVAFFGTRTKREIHERAVEGRWLVAPAWDAADLLADPHLAARDYWVELDGVTHPGPFAKLSGTPIRYRRRAPRLGEHQHLADTADRPTSVAAVPASPRRTTVFDGLRVADFSWVGAGPLISRDLANLGATVLRVESESYIDPLRIIPPWKDGIPDHRTGHSMANFNQSKWGLALDLKVPAALEVAQRLVDWADVVIESFVPGTAARFGLDAATLRARRPGLITLSSCMRGQTGPEATYTGFGLQGAALAGFVAVTGWAERLPAGPFAAYSDFIAPRYSLAALGAALHHRARTGEGQSIDLSQVEAAMHFLEPVLLDAAVNGRVAGLRGADSDRACPHGAYATAGTERFIAVAVENPAQWRALCEVLPSLPSLTALPVEALDDLPARLARRADLETAMATACAAEDAFALGERLRRAGVPAYPVLRATDLTADPQLTHRGFFVELDHPVVGPLRYDGPTTILSATPHRPLHAGPTIGQHTAEVLRVHLGYDDDEIGALAATGALT